MALVLEEQLPEAHIAVEPRPMEQGGVPLGVRDDLGGRGKHDLLVSPYARRGAAAPAAPLGEALQQLLAGELGRAVTDLQQAAALHAAGVGVGLDHLVATAQARLPGLRPLDIEAHGSTRAPMRSTCATRIAAGIEVAA